MGRPSFRNKLVSSGMRTVHQRGFATVGVREITAAAGVAQGSFTNHFASKEAFGLAVLDHYFDQLQAVMDTTLRDERRAPLERLDAYFDAITALLSDAGWHHGCLAGNLGLEAAEHSELIRTRLSEHFAQWSVPFADVLREAQSTGAIRSDFDANEAGAALLEAWQGAMLRMKIDRTSAALDRFRRVILPAVTGAAMPAVNS